ncbi:unnamed protein product [Cylicocyclus nassatus]|uniref:MARVEL domain-containing protein n=1 Tax=Cylicocyclus nassatus TaxID=53992 RepID=A0AA36M332_CYLNA|nr:unnamed protein product [Cylicocyclus nassatus]
MCSIALFGSFAFLISYVFALDEFVSSTSWFIVESTYCTVIAVALLTCALIFLLITSSHWADVNPSRQAAAAFASGSMFVCSLIHFIDGLLLLGNWKRYSWDINGPNALTRDDIAF